LARELADKLARSAAYYSHNGRRGECARPPGGVRKDKPSFNPSLDPKVVGFAYSALKEGASASRHLFPSTLPLNQ
jgi:hypothetical protein